MYQRILVPFDGSETSTLGLQEALKLAQLTGATLLLVYVVDELAYATGIEAATSYAVDLIPILKQGGEAILARGRSLAEAAQVKVETVLLEGLLARVSESVVAQARSWHADVIVLGTHGRHGLGRVLLGSDAEQILRIAPVPVLLVRGATPQ